MKKIVLALMALSSLSAFADQRCKTLTPNDDPFGRAWLATEQGNDSYTFCAEVDGVNLTKLTVQHDFGEIYPVEANRKNAKHFCKVLIDAKAISFEKSASTSGVSLFATVTSKLANQSGASGLTIETPEMNPAFASLKCSK